MSDNLPAVIDPAELPAETIRERAENLPAIRDHYHGIAQAPFPKEVCEILMAPVNPDDVEIKPDGILYYPNIQYRRKLNAAFGPGAWGLMPISEFVMKNGTMSREYAMYVYNRYVTEARGEQDFIPTNKNTSEATATEGVRSNALMRCCKDLGIASELWEPRFIRNFKKTHAVCVWCTNVSKDGKDSGKKKTLWRRKDSPKFDYPWREGNASQEQSTEHYEESPRVEEPEQPPEPVDAVVEELRTWSASEPSIADINARIAQWDTIPKDTPRRAAMWKIFGALVKARGLVQCPSDKQRIAYRLPAQEEAGAA